MNQRPRHTIFDLAVYFGLRIEFRDDLPANNAGYLDPHDEPQYIALNRNLPHCEQVFTAAHELCHYISGHTNPRRKFRNRLLDHKPKSRPTRIYVRYVRHCVNRTVPIELEANMYAMSWLVHKESLTDLLQFIGRHPGKLFLCLYEVLIAFINMPFRWIKTCLGKLPLTQPKS